MSISKLKIKEQHVDGGIVSLIGLFILVNALQIRNNPGRLHASVSPIMVFLTEAKFFPVLLSIILIALGICLALEKKENPSYWNVGETFSTLKTNGLNTIGALVITTAYVVLIGNMNFYLVTFLYILVFVMFLQRNEIKSVGKFVKVFVIVVISTLCTAVLIPTAFNMFLP